MFLGIVEIFHPFQKVFREIITEIITMWIYKNYQKFFFLKLENLSQGLDTKKLKNKIKKSLKVLRLNKKLEN